MKVLSSIHLELQLKLLKLKKTLKWGRRLKTLLLSSFPSQVQVARMKLLQLLSLIEGVEVVVVLSKEDLYILQQHRSHAKHLNAAVLQNYYLKLIGTEEKSISCTISHTIA